MTFAKKASDGLRAQRIPLGRAQKFVLDAAATHTIIDLVREKGEDGLSEWGCLARLPYDTAWFETAEYDGMVIGHLMTKDPASQRWTCHVFVKEGDNIHCNPKTYTFDPDSGAEPTDERLTLRLIIAFLSAINALPYGTKRIEPGPGHHTVGMNRLPFFGSSTITFTIPRENHVVYASKALTKAAGALRRRRHAVIGHWRVIERGKRELVCRHLPVEVKDNVGHCSCCGLTVRWIKAHERGDASVGIVEHNYRAIAAGEQKGNTDHRRHH